MFKVHVLFGQARAKDLVLAIKHFASYPSHPNWNPNADINSDNRVDIKDLVLTIKNFGKYWHVQHNTLNISATTPHVADGQDVSTVNVTAQDEHGSPISGQTSSSLVMQE